MVNKNDLTDPVATIGPSKSVQKSHLSVKGVDTTECVLFCPFPSILDRFRDGGFQSSKHTIGKDVTIFGKPESHQS